jgi:hypothetical protein
VEVVAEGPREAVAGLLAALRDPGVAGRPGEVTWVGERLTPARGGSDGLPRAVTTYALRSPGAPGDHGASETLP